MDSTTGGVVHSRKFGSLAWLTHHTSHHLDTWRLSTGEMQLHYYLLSRHTLLQGELYTEMSGLPIGVLGILGVAGHSTVNHSLNFVDPGTGTHTQNVESYWQRVKCKLKRMKGCHAEQLPSYLDEFLWSERHGRCGVAAMRNIPSVIY